MTPAQQFFAYIFSIFLDYNVIIIAGCFFGLLVLQFKEEYFPSKPRVYELAPALLELNLQRKYICKTSKYLPNSKIRTRY